MKNLDDRDLSTMTKHPITILTNLKLMNNFDIKDMNTDNDNNAIKLSTSQLIPATEELNGIDNANPRDEHDQNIKNDDDLYNQSQCEIKSMNRQDFRYQLGKTMNFKDKNPFLEEMRKSIKCTIFNNELKTSVKLPEVVIKQDDEIETEKLQTTSRFFENDGTLSILPQIKRSRSLSAGRSINYNSVASSRRSSIESLDDDDEEKASNSSDSESKLDTSLYNVRSESIHQGLNASNKIFINYQKNMTPQEVLQEIDEQEDPDIHFIKDDDEFYKHYVRAEYLGEGTTSRVEKCYKIKDNSVYAVKLIDYKGDMELLKMLLNEFKNHKKLSHKNIVKVYEMYVNTNRERIYTVLELVKCKDMHDNICENGAYSEPVASLIFKQIIAAIYYMHSQGVCHRDLKPDNILVSNDGAIVKITDFNVSKFIEKKNKNFKFLPYDLFKMWTYTGTIAYLAPEVFIHTEYTPAVDMWSAGIILYTMLCGYHPFQAEYLQDLIELIKQGNYEFHRESWQKISKMAKHLVKKCLTIDPKKRYDPWKALVHPWIARHGKEYKSQDHKADNPSVKNIVSSYIIKGGVEVDDLMDKNMASSQRKLSKSMTFSGKLPLKAIPSEIEDKAANLIKEYRQGLLQLSKSQPLDIELNEKKRIIEHNKALKSPKCGRKCSFEIEDIGSIGNSSPGSLVLTIVESDCF